MTGRVIAGKNIIEVRQGDSFVIRLNFRKLPPEIDLEKAEITMQVRQKNDASLVFELSAQPVDSRMGIFAFILSPEQTNIEVGEYKTDMQLKTADGSVNTFFPDNVNKIGIFRVTEQVTR